MVCLVVTLQSYDFRLMCQQELIVKPDFTCRHVDDEILVILRQRRLECEHYHGHDSDKYCQKVREDYAKAEENWFIKCE